MSFTPRLQALLDALRCLPGVGPKSAQRIAFHLLDKDRDGAAKLVGALQGALDGVGLCEDCRMFAEERLCPMCADSKRDEATVCVVETPADVVAIDESGGYRGLYFVLMGRLSPLDGIGPDELNLASLIDRANSGEVREIILAVNATVEGQTTAHYITDRLEGTGISVTRLAHGVPVGGELDFLDDGTLTQAMKSRTAM